mmetsp:Transcript_17485/g.39381  ORF Transcript_17485/g.39381 Transcript_17485/m.39381 type:complete len:309 (-) Transcript_17485:900-1826(-)
MVPSPFVSALRKRASISLLLTLMPNDLKASLNSERFKTPVPDLFQIWNVMYGSSFFTLPSVFFSTLLVTSFQAVAQSMGSVSASILEPIPAVRTFMFLQSMLIGLPQFWHFVFTAVSFCSRPPTNWRTREPQAGQVNFTTCPPKSRKLTSWAVARRPKTGPTIRRGMESSEKMDSNSRSGTSSVSAAIPMAHRVRVASTMGMTLKAPYICKLALTSSLTTSLVLLKAASRKSIPSLRTLTPNLRISEAILSKVSGASCCLPFVYNKKAVTSCRCSSALTCALSSFHSSSETTASPRQYANAALTNLTS